MKLQRSEKQKKDNLMGAPSIFVALAVLISPCSITDNVNFIIVSIPHERNKPFISSLPRRRMNTGLKTHMKFVRQVSTIIPFSFI